MSQPVNSITLQRAAAAAGITFMLGSMDRLVSKSFVVNFYARSSIRKLSAVYHQYYEHFDGHRHRREKTDDQSGHAQHLWDYYTDLQRPRLGA